MQLSVAGDSFKVSVQLQQSATIGFGKGCDQDIDGGYGNTGSA
jgi:hypothetical protein